MSTAEEQRVIELYKYHVSDQLWDKERLSQSEAAEEPPSDSLDIQAQIFETGMDNKSQISSPHTTLTALCQLTAIRLGVQRAGISLIARQAQHILAESTQTLNLRDTTKSDESGDGLWMGLTECNRRGNLCENTVCLPPARDADIPPCFIVPDLRLEPRFGNAPYVAGPPYMKFYCGTPITTANNFNIGSFWVLDSRLLPEFTLEQKRFFGTMASLIMKQFEMTREVSERQRAMKMGQALSNFVDGTLPINAQAHKEDRTSAFHTRADEPSEAMHDSIADHVSDSASKSHQDLYPELEPTGGTRPSPLTDGSTEERQDTPSSGVHSTLSDESGPEESIDMTFSRAAYLIQEALDVHGCVFLDSAPTRLSELSRNWKTGLNRSDSAQDATVHSHDERATENASMTATTWSTASNGAPADILAFACENGSSLTGDGQVTGKHFTPVDASLLNNLTKRYPNGTMWTFGEAGLLTPTELSSPTPIFGKRSSGSGVKLRKQQREAEAEALRHYFPHARQLLFAPLFDAALERSTAGCFAFNNRRSRVLTTESEVVFLKSFVNNVGAEISRMNTIAADRSKSDFIGSVSHELRSPLHGMLAAAEFLEETQLDSYQQGLIATQVSCGKTLLQVIEHVLDFSKINSFAKDESIAGEENNERMLGTKMQALSMRTDLAELFEEVVEGSVAGKAHIVQDIAALDSRPSSTSTSTDDLAEKSYDHSLQKNSKKEISPGVAVLLDFNYQKDWTFITQPGALRRILMNVLGNALKYTDFGYVRVHLAMAESHRAEDSEISSMISFSIADTGKGISRSFLRKRLFRPFNQEDHLSTGCGLGLSIVKSLVASLKGTLEVQSEQGVGTTVSIKLPLVRERQSHLESPPIRMQDFGQLLSLPSSFSRTVALLRPKKQKPAAGDHVSSDSLAVREETRVSALKTMIEWLQMKSFNLEQQNEYPEYVIFLADDISAIEYDSNLKHSKAIALLPNNFSRAQAKHLLGHMFAIFEVIGAPFGPRKLARAVASCEATTSQRHKGSTEESGPSTLAKVDPKIVATSSRIDQDPNEVSTMRTDALVENFAHSSEVRASQGPIVIADGAGEGHDGIVISIRSNKSHSQSSPIRNGVKDSQVQETHRESTRPKTSKRIGGARLLLVDDNKINLSLLETFVKRHKRKLAYDRAENGLLAVEAARQNPSGYDIIFMDVSMPGMDGLEATREIRKLERERIAKMGEADAPSPALIIALTGLANGRDQVDAFASGVDLFMTKPTKFKEIGSLIEGWYENGLHQIEARRKGSEKD